MTGIRGEVLLRGIVHLGKAALALQVRAHGDDHAALRHHLAIKGDLWLQFDEAAQQAGG
jgi:hypothetical protein